MIAAARIGFVLFLSLVGSMVSAAPVQGTDYTLIQPSQTPTTTGKVEVIEFFSYGCPHCFHMAPLLKQWQKTELPANAVLVRVPVSFGRREWGQLVRAYYTLEATGDLGRLDADRAWATRRVTASAGRGRVIWSGWTRSCSRPFMNSSSRCSIWRASRRGRRRMASTRINSARRSLRRK